MHDDDYYVGVLMYTSKLFDGSKVDNAISLWTLLINLPYVAYKSKFKPSRVMEFAKDCFAHTEVMIPLGRNGFFGLTRDNNGRFKRDYHGYCVTSTMRGEDNGTVCRSSSEVLTHPERWKIGFVKTKHKPFSRALYWTDTQITGNKGYAKADITKFFGLGTIIADDERNICSEFVHNFLVVLNFIKDKFKVISPRKLAWVLKTKYNVTFENLEDAKNPGE